MGEFSLSAAMIPYYFFPMNHIPRFSSLLVKLNIKYSIPTTPNSEILFSATYATWSNSLPPHPPTHPPTHSLDKFPFLLPLPSFLPSFCHSVSFISKASPHPIDVCGNHPCLLNSFSNFSKFIVISPFHWGVLRYCMGILVPPKENHKSWITKIHNDNHNRIMLFTCWYVYISFHLSSWIPKQLSLVFFLSFLKFKSGHQDIRMWQSCGFLSSFFDFISMIVYRIWSFCQSSNCAVLSS